MKNRKKSNSGPRHLFYTFPPSALSKLVLSSFKALEAQTMSTVAKKSFSCFLFLFFPKLSISYKMWSSERFGPLLRYIATREAEKVGAFVK